VEAKEPGRRRSGGGAANGGTVGTSGTVLWSTQNSLLSPSYLIDTTLFIMKKAVNKGV